MKNLSQILYLLPLLFGLSCSTTDGWDMSGTWNYPSEGAYGEQYASYAENPFLDVSENPVSTFSVDADGASYANMRRYVNQGQLPPQNSVRIEEYINYFTFDYPDAAGDESISLNSELSTCPWNSEHALLRLGIKGKNIENSQLPPSNYVLLIDISGSMNSSDKIGLLKAGFSRMIDNLRDDDRVAIVVYAGNAKVLLNSTPASEKGTIKDVISSLSAGGSTAGHDGLSEAYKIAKENFVEGGNNRIILGSDGDFNVGPSSVDELIKLVEENRDSGVFITVLGVGTGNLNDHMAEQIANNGNGNYEYIDNVEEIEKVFIHERSKFYTVAKDCKLQLTFNPENIKSYRLIGYDNRMLNAEDFEDDKKDAGEIGVGQTITALYEVVLTEKFSKEKETSKLATFDVRYKKTNNETSRPLSMEISSPLTNITEASENMRFTSAVTAFALVLKDSEYKGSAKKETILDLAKSSITFDPNGYRKEFIQLVEKIKE